MRSLNQDLLKNGYFYNPSRGNLLLKQVIEELFSYMKEKPERFYDVIVGCDSSSQEEPSFPVVLVILRKGEGGRFFLKKVGYKNRKFYNYHQRILEEVYLSCELALFLKEDIEKMAKELSEQGFSFSNYQFRYIHADIGERGQTRDMIKEVVGLIQGNGFEAKIKPESFVASSVADRFT
ncbi:hypothetical protein KAT95_00630 [Candidatus Parcubacteria bacterium]|nr:hypothetical protein [Candidatus Parcubacteria bacterium]